MFYKKIEIYKNIDEMPIWNFKKILESGDLSYMLSTGVLKQKVRKKTAKALDEAWISVYNQYLQTFGLNKLYIQILEQEEKIAFLKIQMWTRGKKGLSAIIKAEEKRLADMIIPNKGNKQSFEQDLVVIQKHNGFLIEAKQTSVRMFYTYVKTMEKEADEIRMRNARENR